MSKPYFQFKQFKVFHDKSSMKVGTDAVLLACLTNFNDTKEILEVGCGSGVISLMSAQLCSADILAIDIHQESVNQAQFNFDASPWKNRLKSKNISFQDLAIKSHQKYDLIISNPPFFIDSLKSPEGNRNLARHNDRLSQLELLQSARQRLKTNGKLSLILPQTEGEELISIALEEGFYLTTRINIKPKPSKPANRMVIELCLHHRALEQKELSIRKENNDYTQEYRELTSEFYLSL